MALELKVKNNASGSLSAGISDSATSLSLKAGEGSKFPAITGTQYFYATLQKSNGNWEIVKVTAISGDNFTTIVRNVDSSTGAAQAFSVDDIVSLRPISQIIADIINEINDKNSASVIIPAPAGTKMIFYQDAAPLGWTRDLTVVDALIAIKGGSSSYNVNGGTLAGTWVQPNHNHEYVHTHNLNHIHSVDDHLHQYWDGAAVKSYDSDGTLVRMTMTTKDNSILVVGVLNGDGYYSTLNFYTKKASGVNTGQPDDPATDSQSATTTSDGATISTHRPYAAVSIVATKD